MIARKEKAGDRRVRIGQRGIWIEGEWWVWDKERKELSDGRGRSWSEWKGKEEQEKRKKGGKYTEENQGE